MENIDAAARKEILNISIEVAIRLSVLALLTVWCALIFRPFVLPIMWAIILAVVLAKPFGRFVALLGGRLVPVAWQASCSPSSSLKRICPAAGTSCWWWPAR
jgi:predicted PurR-regulated permease PerM